MIPTLIQDPHLTPDLKRTRNGSTQLFSKPGKMSFDPDFSIEPPERHIYAELIDNQWFWVNGCPECKGEEPTWSNTYIKCIAHDVCCDCKTPRAQLKEIPWGHPKGFKCKPCADLEHEVRKKKALVAMPDSHDKWDYTYQDNPTCPHCNYKFLEGEHNLHSSDGDLVKCDLCDNSFTVTAHPSVTYTTARIE